MNFINSGLTWERDREAEVEGCDIARPGPDNGLIHRLCFDRNPTMDRAIIMICDMQYYGPRECDMRNANTLWATRKRYAICEYALGRANAMRDMRIHYGPRECYMRYANFFFFALIEQGTYVMKKEKIAHAHDLIVGSVGCL